MSSWTSHQEDPHCQLPSRTPKIWFCHLLEQAVANNIQAHKSYQTKIWIPLNLLSNLLTPSPTGSQWQPSLHTPSRTCEKTRHSSMRAPVSWCNTWRVLKVLLWLNSRPWCPCKKCKRPYLPSFQKKLLSKPDRAQLLGPKASWFTHHSHNRNRARSLSMRTQFQLIWKRWNPWTLMMTVSATFRKILRNVSAPNVAANLKTTRSTNASPK